MRGNFHSGGDYMTIYEKYYAMNAALNTALIAQCVTCPVFKYGSVVKKGNGYPDVDGQPVSYPYIQTTFRVTKRQPNGSKTSGTLIDFEYTLNFFTAAAHERMNDSELFEPYEMARELIVNPDFLIWRGIANVLNHDETPEFNFRGGLEVLQKGLIFRCQSVVSHVIDYVTEEVDIDDAMEVIEDSINFENDEVEE
jgi:hypothetical protein